MRERKKQTPMCSLRALTYLQVPDLPRQWMVGPSSDSRLTKQRRESEANGPQGQRPARVSRRGPSWTEFVRLADQAVVAIAGTDMKNRAEPRACGHSRGSRRLDTEPEAERTAAPAGVTGPGFARVQTTAQLRAGEPVAEFSPKRTFFLLPSRGGNLCSGCWWPYGGAT
jgi:hypothetical protein